MRQRPLPRPSAAPRHAVLLARVPPSRMALTLAPRTIVQGLQTQLESAVAECESLAGRLHGMRAVVTMLDRLNEIHGMLSTFDADLDAGELHRAAVSAQRMVCSEMPRSCLACARLLLTGARVWRGSLYCCMRSRRPVRATARRRYFGLCWYARLDFARGPRTRARAETDVEPQDELRRKRVALKDRLDAAWNRTVSWMPSSVVSPTADVTMMLCVKLDAVHSGRRAAARGFRPALLGSAHLADSSSHPRPTVTAESSPATAADAASMAALAADGAAEYSGTLSAIMDAMSAMDMLDGRLRALSADLMRYIFQPLATDARLAPVMRVEHQMVMLQLVMSPNERPPDGHVNVGTYAPLSRAHGAAPALNGPRQWCCTHDLPRLSRSSGSTCCAAQRSQPTRVRTTARTVRSEMPMTSRPRRQSLHFSSWAI